MKRLESGIVCVIPQLWNSNNPLFSSSFVSVCVLSVVMSQGTASTGQHNNNVDFHIPDEILSVIPTDPYQQLDLARKITSMAIASRVSSLESDSSSLRQKLLDKDRVIHDLEQRVSGLGHACHEAESRLKTALDDNVMLCYLSGFSFFYQNNLWVSFKFWFLFWFFCWVCT